MSYAQAYSLKAVHQQQLNADLMALEGEDPKELSFCFSDQDREQFVSHVTEGVKKMMEPVELNVQNKINEIVENQQVINKFINTETEKYMEAKPIREEIQRTLYQIPVYKLKLDQIKREMVSINKRSAKLSSKSEQLRHVRDKIKQKQLIEESKLARLEARVVNTTRATRSSTSSKHAVVDES